MYHYHKIHNLGLTKSFIAQVKTTSSTSSTKLNSTAQKISTIIIEANNSLLLIQRSRTFDSIRFYSIPFDPGHIKAAKQGKQKNNLSESLGSAGLSTEENGDLSLAGGNVKFVVVVFHQQLRHNHWLHLLTPIRRFLPQKHEKSDYERRGGGGDEEQRIGNGIAERNAEKRLNSANQIGIGSHQVNSV